MKRGPNSFTDAIDLDARVSRVPKTVIRGGDDVGAFNLGITINVTYEALEHFEASRAGAPHVELAINLEMIVCPIIDRGGEWAPADRFVLGCPHWVPDVEIVRQRQGEGDGPLALTFARDEWHEVLRELGFADVLVFELPRRIAGADSTPFVTARAELEKARRAHDHGFGDEVAHHAYRAIEALAPTGNGGLVDRITAEYLSRQNPEVLARLRNALIALLPTIHVGRHMAGDAAQPAVPVNREHAAWIYGTAMMVVGWCASVRARGG